MGNCLYPCPSPEEEPSKSNALIKAKDGEQSSNLTTVRENLILSARSRGDVKKYYSIVKVLGEGSMGSVSLAKKNRSFVGGSAYTKTRKGWFGRTVEERVNPPEEVISESETKLFALKSIILSRVSVSSLVRCRYRLQFVISCEI